ncbi:PAS domain S-box protein [Natrarchaeobius halalkaliphilus]|uniref:PAS domain S-box protein n=1 Tax=Natrarchaeobius halalkaliphilus TaxID=1679091 RepID=A0A3N6LHI2_9EURY|nr:GAF domain-containing protein [Natrarchaeobius halalkaliphilus]RQG86160.1 PAS domain S-box protein [Natrarchaeobius halalkaliphilus]
MDGSLEALDTSPLRVLVVGSPGWGRTTTAALEESPLGIEGPVSSRTDWDRDSLDSREPGAIDCLLTDDRDVLSSVEDRCPVVYVTGDADLDCDGSSVEQLLEDGATDVVFAETDSQAVLEHRIRRTVEFASTRSADGPESKRYRKLLEHASDTVIVLDERYRITTITPNSESSDGEDLRSHRAKSFLDTIHPDDRTVVLDALDTLSAEAYGSTTTVEYSHRHDDGSRICEATFTNCLGDGVLDGIVGSVRDVTAYHRVERELDESLQRVTDAFFALDPEWRFTYLNDRALEGLAVDRSKLVGRSVLEIFPELEGSVFHHAAIDAMDHQESRTVEGYFEPYDSWIEARIYPSPTGVSVYWRDVTDRIEREWTLNERTERLKTLIENVPVVLFDLDSDGTFTFAEGRALEDLEIDSSEVVGNSISDILSEYSRVEADLRASLEGYPVYEQWRICGRAFEAWCRPIVRDGTIERVTGIAVDVTDRAQYRDALSALHDATNHLLTVESKEAACEYIVDVASGVLDLEGIVYRFDDQQNELIPAAYSPGLAELVGSPPDLRPRDDSITWETFVSRTPVMYDDVRESERVYNSQTDVRSGLYVPLGEHGVFVAASPVDGAFDEQIAELAQLFATTAEAALDRIGRTQRLHDRERELKRQNRYLERLNETNEVRQEIGQHLLMADSRAEIERKICERFVDLDACSMAWLGEPNPSGNRLESRTSAGRDHGYLEAITVTTADDSATEPTGRAARTGEAVYVENVAGSVHDGSWRAQALSRNFQSVYAVPLVYDGFLYGVLSLYGEESNAFDSVFRSTLADQAETIAYTIDAVKRKTALLGDEVTELELEIDRQSILLELSEHLDERIVFEGSTTRDEVTIVFVSLEEPIDEAILDDELEDMEGIVDVSIIENDERTLLQLVTEDPVLDSIVTAHGGTVREFVAGNGTAWATIDIPGTVDVREVVSTINRRGIPATMVARREQSTDDRPTLDASSRTRLLDLLTERQREVVQTAYHGGFFEWPRRTTGEEIAASLDISSPAFHRHVRSTEQKLLETLFDDRLEERG